MLIDINHYINPDIYPSEERYVLPFLCITVTGFAHCLDQHSKLTGFEPFLKTYVKLTEMFHVLVQSFLQSLKTFTSHRLPDQLFSVTAVVVHGIVVDLCTRYPVIARVIKEAIENLL